MLMKNFTKFLAVLMVMVFTSSLSFAQYARITDTGPAGVANAQMSTRAVLYDQMGNLGTDGGVSAQDFETSFDVYDAEGADDFTVPAGETWNVDNVAIHTGFSDGWGPLNTEPNWKTTTP